MDALHKKTGLDLLDRITPLSEKILARQYAEQPELERRYGPVGRDKCLQDIRYHLSYLAQAVSASQQALFSDYVAWAKVLLAKYKVPAEDLRRNLEIMQGVITSELPADEAAVACAFIGEALRMLPEMPTDVHSFITDHSPVKSNAARYLEALLNGQRHAARQVVMDALDSGLTVKEVYLDIFQPAQYEIGRLWQTNQISVATEHYVTAATQLIMSELYPRIFSYEKRHGVMVAACVSGELHEIGVRMVSDFFEMEGWDTYYLGANTPQAGILQALVERKADVLGISATITHHVRFVSELIVGVRAHPVLGRVKILVGGYPFNVAPDLWIKVGADGFGRDAQDAVALARRLTKGGNRQ